jgi:phosphoribosylanthranilate isomerase
MRLQFFAWSRIRTEADMSIIVKICGLTSEEAIDAALENGADMTGFVFYPRSPRHLSMNDAARFVHRVGARARRVLLLVDPDEALLTTAMKLIDPDIFQLHGQETPERVASIRERFGRPVMKALPIADASDLASIVRYEPFCDYLLFDAKPGPDAKRPGGNGTTFDWSLLRGVETRKPWLLAGGLDPENVAQALDSTGAPGVDVSSGVEASRGVKDPDKIAAFIGKVRAAEKLAPAAQGVG